MEERGDGREELLVGKEGIKREKTSAQTTEKGTVRRSDVNRDGDFAAENRENSAVRRKRKR